MGNKGKYLNKKTILSTLVGLTLIAGSLSFAQMDSANDKGESPKPKVSIVKDPKIEKEVIIGVSVTEAYMIDYTPVIKGNGEVQAKIELDYQSEVSGRVTYVSPSFDEGFSVKKDDILIKIDDTKYKEALASAKLSLTEAKLNLLEEEREAEQAQLEWESSGLKGKPESELVLRKPQLENAKAAYDKAMASYNTAKKDLENTIIKAPFDAYIAERNINIGNYIQSGTEIGLLYGTQKYQIKVPLSQKQWQYLPQSIENKNLDEITVKDVLDDKKWIGYLSRVEKKLNSDTRQRALYVEIENPLEKDLYSGIFTQVFINGEKIKNVWELPQTAINAVNIDGTSEILMINEEMKIKKINVLKIFENSDNVFVRPLNEEFKEGRFFIINKPLITYKNGTKVKILGENNA